MGVYVPALVRIPERPEGQLSSEEDSKEGEKGGRGWEGEGGKEGPSSCSTYLGDCEGGAPLVLEDVEADAAVGVDIAVIDARREVHLQAKKREREREGYVRGCQAAREAPKNRHEALCFFKSHHTSHPPSLLIAHVRTLGGLKG